MSTEENPEILPLTHEDINKLVKWVEKHVFKGNEYKFLGPEGVLNALERAVERGVVTFEGTVVADTIQSAITEIAWEKNHNLDDYPFTGYAMA